MARYIDADKLNKKKKYLFQTQGMPFPKSEWFIKADDLFSAPTADVIPREAMGEAIEKFIDAQDKVICEAKAEVAREIVEFIEGKIKDMEDHAPTEDLDRAIGLVNWILSGVTYELKKKYTGEQT